MTSQIRVDEITNRSGLGTVTIYDNGFEFTGVTTFTEDVDITGGLTIGGVLTYEDVTNVDSVGVVTARAGIRVTGDSIHVESSEDRLLYLKSTDANAYLTFEDTDSSSAFANRVGTVSDGLYFSTGGGGERVRIDSSGRVLIGRTSVLASSAERLTINSGMGIIRNNSTGTGALYLRNEDSTADTRHPYLIFTDGSGNRGGIGIQNDQSSLWISGQQGIAFRTGGSAPSTTERLRITSSGQLLSGATAARTDFATTPQVQIEGLDFPTSSLSITRNSNDNGRPTLFFGKSRGSVDGATTIVADGDGLGTIEFAGADGDQLHRAALIAGQVDGTPSNNGMKGRLVFSTNSGGTSATERLRIASDGDLTLTGADNVEIKMKCGTSSGNNILAFLNSSGTTRGNITYDSDNNFLLFNVNQSERLRITSDGKIGLDGMTNPVAKLHIGTEDDAALTAQTVFVEGAKTGYANYTGLPQNQLCLYDNTASTAGSGGAISFGANCGGSQQTWIAAIESQRDSGTNDASNYAGSIVFWTRPAQSTPTEKLRILSGGGITFNGDTAAANALDDYEEGTWTPTCASASSVSYSNQYGRYTKVGNCITIWWDLIWTSLSGGNNARIGGLPYTPVVNTNQGGYGIPVFRDASGTNSDNRVYGNSSYFLTDGIRLQHYNSSGNPTSGSFNGSGRITGWAQYFDNNAY